MNNFISRTICFLILISIVSCTPDLELNPETEQPLAEVLLEIPDGFDFKTSEMVSITIHDTEADALYKVYAQYRTIDLQLPDSLQLNYDEVKKNDIAYNFKFSGTTQNGSLSQQIAVPTYAKKVFIRRKGAEGFTDYVASINNQSVVLNHNKSSSKHTSSKQQRSAFTIVSSPLSGDVFVNGNALIAAGLNTNGFDLEVTGNLTISGATNLANTSSITASNIIMSGNVNLNGGLIFSDQITVSGNLNGSGFIYYCVSYTVTGNINHNQATSVIQQQCGSDSDGDGVADVDDAYPDDPTKAYQIFSPSPSDYAVLFFEDLWPSYGDYDFNDVALRYRRLIITNAQNKAVQVDFICDVKNSAAGYTNGIGVEYTGLSPSSIQIVTGTLYTEGYITTNSNGTEAAQSSAVVVFTDNADNLLTQTTVSIVLTSPTNTSSINDAKFNPFIISNKNRAREIHLPNKPSTTLGSNAIDNGGMNSDPYGNFISTQGFSWGLSILEDVPTPKEGVRISDAYNLFDSWATSGGINDEDWYKDLPGHRNTALLDND